MNTDQQTEIALAALGDATRRRIVERLASGPCAVGEVARDLPVGRPAVSMHLRVLSDAGLVVGKREGNRRLYQLNPETLISLRDYFDSFWSEVLFAYSKAAEQERKNQS
jgi:DNA-binding transcriptional ArsR family regulator